VVAGAAHNLPTAGRGSTWLLVSDRSDGTASTGDGYGPEPPRGRVCEPDVFVPSAPPRRTHLPQASAVRTCRVVPERRGKRREAADPAAPARDRRAADRVALGWLALAEASFRRCPSPVTIRKEVGERPLCRLS
jgi:hypothetical protein